MNVTETGTVACNSRTALIARDDASASEAGNHRCHGEDEQASACTMKRMLEASVLIAEPSEATAMQPEPGHVNLVTGYARHGSAVLESRSERQPVLPGVESATYSTKGSSFEHGNLDSSAGKANPGKLTGPATSRTRGGVSVVVRARESRVHGEGRQ